MVFWRQKQVQLIKIFRGSEVILPAVTQLIDAAGYNMVRLNSMGTDFMKVQLIAA